MPSTAPISTNEPMRMPPEKSRARRTHIGVSEDLILAELRLCVAVGRIDTFIPGSQGRARGRS